MKRVGQTSKNISNSSSISFLVTNMKMPFWSFLFSDQYFLPRITLHIKNTGREIPIASISYYSGILDNTNSINSLITYSGILNNIHNTNLTNWKEGETKDIRIKFSANQTQPNNYFIFLRISEMFNQTTTITEQIKQIEKFELEQIRKDEIISDMIKEREINNTDLVHFQEGFEIYQMYLCKAIKVNSFNNSLTIILTITGLIIAIIAIYN